MANYVTAKNEFLFHSEHFSWQPFQPTPAALPTSLAGWMANPSTVPHPSASAGPIGLAAPNNAGGLYNYMCISAYVLYQVVAFGLIFYLFQLGGSWHIIPLLTNFIFVF